MILGHNLEDFRINLRDLRLVVGEKQKLHVDFSTEGFPPNISLQFLADHSARASQWNLVFSFTTAFSIPL